MYRAVTAFFLFYTFCIPSSAQLIQGVVLTDGGEVPVGAVISLADITGHVIDHWVVNEDPRWQLEAGRNGLYRIEAQLLGYEKYDTLLRLVVDTLHLSIVLKPEVFQLSGVEIAAHYAKVEVMGDTTRFHLAGYLDGTERYLEDVLMKMPGVEISKDGQILFYGKQVRVLLIDGHNILNDKHEFALRSIDIASVESIDFVERYQGGIAQNEASGSEAVAMDIHFKESAKGKPQASLTTLYAPLKRYLLSFDLLSVSDKLAYTVFARNNNVLEEVLSGGDYMRLQTGSENFLDILSSLASGGRVITGSDLIPPEFQLSDDIRLGNDALLAGNFSLLLSERSKLRLSLMAARFQRSKEFGLERVMFSDSTELSGLMREKALSYLGNAQMEFEQILSDKWQYALSVNYLMRDYAKEGEAKFMDVPLSGLESASFQIEHGRSFSTTLQWKYRQDKRTSQRLKLSLFSDCYRRADSLSVSDSIFMPARADASGHIAYVQSLVSRPLNLEAKWIFNRKVQFGKYALSLATGQEREVLSVQNFLLQNNPAPRRDVLYAGPGFVLDMLLFSHWWIRLSAKTHYAHLVQQDADFYFWRNQANVSVSYLLKKGHKGNSLSLSYHYALLPASFESTNAYLLLSDERNLLHGNVAVEESLLAKHNWSLGWIVKAASSRLSYLNLGCSYSYQDAALLRQVNWQGKYWLNTYRFFNEPITSFTAYSVLFASMPAFLMGFKSNLFFSQSNFWVFIDDVNYLSARQQTIQGNIQIDKSFWEGKIKMGLGCEFMRTVSFLTAVEDYGFVQYGFSAFFHLAPVSRWHFSGRVSRAASFYETEQKTFWDLNLEWTWDLNAHWQILLDAQHLANLNGQLFQFPVQTQYYTEFKTYRTSPGFIAIGVKRKW